MDDVKVQLRSAAKALGFDDLRVTLPGGIGPAGERLMEFLAAGYHGDMGWMQTHADRRSDPRVLWPDVKSVLMLTMSYAPASDPRAALLDRSSGVISVYAQGKDYHDIVKPRLKRLAGEVTRLLGGDVKVFVDTAPLMEKPLAAAAGLGWQGRHTNLVSRDLGSWFFLGAILSTAEIAPDAPEADHCGSCARCLTACPTAAFPEPYRLDPRRCISYLTIEHKGHIAREFRTPMANRVYGCDDCLAVCPWNKFAVLAREAGFTPRSGAKNPPLAELLALDDAAFRARFAGSPIKRTGRDRVVRNALIAAGNSGDPALRPLVQARLNDLSPLVRAMAVWALQRLVSKDDYAEAKGRHLPHERDADVRAEWLTEETS